MSNTLSNQPTGAGSGRDVRPIARAEIAADLRQLGIMPGSVVLVHSSLRSLGWVEGGADAVLSALRDAVAPEGTVLAPTLTGTPEDGPDQPPRFDPRQTPCWTGAIAEAFRRHPERQRSRHPTHSVACIGPGAGWLIAGHAYCGTPCAAESPYGRLAESGGLILLLGVDHTVNTSLHMVEELGGAPYHLQDRPTTSSIARDDGGWEEVTSTLHLWRWGRDFNKVEPLLQQAGAQRSGAVGASQARLVEARALRDLIVPRVREDPLFLLDSAARSAYLAEQRLIR